MRVIGDNGLGNILKITLEAFIIILSIVIISFMLGMMLPDKFKTNKTKEISNNSEQINEKELSSEQENNENLRYYLHKSNLEIPNRNTRYIAQTKALQGLTEDRKEYIQENFRYDHVSLEWNLLGAVNVLKDKNSSYWDSYTKAGIYQSPDGTTSWESDGRFSKILENIENYTNELQNETAKNDLKNACKLLKDGIDSHDIGKFFEAHEIIHDYDYWIISVEPSFVTFPPADWTGTRTYFGKATIMKQ